MNLFKELFGHNQFHKDSTNNAEPTKVLKNLTGYSRQERPSTLYKQIRNYQVSHIFGRTKNPFSFTAPWNIVYVPKIMDPFTGHESKGVLTERFKKDFQLHFFIYYQEYIREFNMIMMNLKSRLLAYLNEQEGFVNQKFKNDTIKQFSPIFI